MVVKCDVVPRSCGRDVRFRFDSWKNRFFWSKNRYFESILLVEESVFWIDSSKELVSVFWMDSFGQRIGILNRFFERIGIGILNRFFWSKNRYFESVLRKNWYRYFESILWSKNRYFEPILYRQNRNRNGRAIQRLEFWDWWLFFLGARFLPKTVWKCYWKLEVILVIIFITVFSKSV